MSKRVNGARVVHIARAYLLASQAWDNLGKVRSILWATGDSDAFEKVGGEVAEKKALLLMEELGKLSDGLAEEIDKKRK